MVQGYDPIIKALAKDIDIRLNHRYSFIILDDSCTYIFISSKEKHAKKQKTSTLSKLKGERRKIGKLSHCDQDVFKPK